MNWFVVKNALNSLIKIRRKRMPHIKRSRGALFKRLIDEAKRRKADQLRLSVSIAITIPGISMLLWSYQVAQVLLNTYWIDDVVYFIWIDFNSKAHLSMVPSYRRSLSSSLFSNLQNPCWYKARRIQGYSAGKRKMQYWELVAHSTSNSGRRKRS